MTRRVWLLIAVVGVVPRGAGVGTGAAAWAGGDHDEDSAAAGHPMEPMGEGHGAPMSEIAANTMAASSIVARYALELKRLRLPGAAPPPPPHAEEPVARPATVP